jgi:tetratricopeptide (TPR) repeat protein
LENKSGETLHRWWGYRKESFIEEIRSGLDDPTTIAEKLRRYAKNPDLKTALALASNYYTQGESKKVVNYYLDAAKFDPNNDYAYELYNAYRSGFGHAYTEEDVIRAADFALASTFISDVNKLRIYDQMSAAIIDLRGNKTILGYIKAGNEFAKNISDKDQQNRKDRIHLAYVLYIEKNENEAIRIKKESYKEGWRDDARELNSFSWWCFEHQINLDEAEQLSRRGVKLSQPGSEKAMILDTVAEIVFLKGDKEEAVELTKKAIKEYPESEYYKKQLIRFEKSLASDL